MANPQAYSTNSETTTDHENDQGKLRLRRRRSSAAATAPPNLREVNDIEMNVAVRNPDENLRNEVDVSNTHALGNGYVNAAFADSNNVIPISTSPDDEQVHRLSTEPTQPPIPPGGKLHHRLSSYASHVTKSARTTLASQLCSRFIRLSFLAAWTAYIIAAWRLSGWERAKIVVLITAVVYICLFIKHILLPLLRWLNFTTSRSVKLTTNFIFRRRYSRLIITIIVSAALALYIILDGYGEPARFQSAIGIVVLTLIGAILSKHPRRIQWSTVIWGLLLQIILGIMVLKWSPGMWFFTFLGDCVDGLLGFTQKGIQFIFGPHPEYHMFAMQVAPIIIFLSFLISALFYSGAMNFIIHYCGLVLFHIMGTTAVESLVAAANIFLGMTEAPLVMRPFIKDVTTSELFAIVAGGFSSTSGSILGVYVTFGIDAVHMLAASVMSAPASLAMSKLFYPEVEKEINKDEKYEKLEMTASEE